MMPTTLAPRDGRAIPEIPPGARYCRRCETVKPVNEFCRRARGVESFRGPCKICKRQYEKAWKASNPRPRVRKQYKRIQPSVKEQRAAAIREAMDAAFAAKQKAAPAPWSIPESECVMQLTIIAACWLSCVEVGAEAIRRLMDRLVDATYLPGIVTNQERARLRADVQSYRIGGMPLDQVERTLRGVVGGGE